MILIAIGVGLEQLHTFVAIVLQSLGATLIVASPLALLSVPVLTVGAALTFAVGPVVNAAARSAFDPRRVYSDAWIDQVLQWLVLSTHYRVVSLLPLVLIGVVLARWGLTRRMATGALVVGLTAGVAVVGLRFAGIGIGVSEVVSGDLPDSLLDVALSGCAIGVIILLARWPLAAPAVTAMAPVRAVGAMALTAYVLHVALIALALRTVEWQAREGSWLLLTIGVFVATILACWAWWHLVGRGPVEQLMALVTDRVR